MDIQGPVADEMFGKPLVVEDLEAGLEPPPFTHPYTLMINPLFLMNPSHFSTKIHERLLQQNVNTVFKPKMFKLLLDMDIPALSARVYHDSGERELEYANNFLAMLWVWDDTVDSTDVGKCKKAILIHILEFHLVTMWSFPNDPVLRTHLVPFLAELGDEEGEAKLRYFDSTLEDARSQPGTVYPRELSILGTVFRDVWADSLKMMPPVSCLRLAHALQLWLSGVLRESEIRKSRSVPASMDEIITIRRATSAVQTTLVIVDAMCGTCTPDEWYNSPEMQRVVLAITDLIAWHNDIWSFNREVLAQKDAANLVSIISVYRNVSSAAAADIVTDMLNVRLADLELALSDLRFMTSPELEENFAAYSKTCKAWMSGAFDWTATCSRYVGQCLEEILQHTES